MPSSALSTSQYSFDRAQESKSMAIESQFSNIEWKSYLQKEISPPNYPQYKWKLKFNKAGEPIFRKYQTISRHLLEEQDSDIFPFGDLPSPVACLEPTETLQDARNAYLISALRFKLNPYDKIQTTDSNQLLGIPETLRNLYEKLEFERYRVDIYLALKVTSQDAFESALAEIQQKARYWYHQELVPNMNANPFDPELHYQELSIENIQQIIKERRDSQELPFPYPYCYRTNLSPEMVHDLSQYVRLQNSPYLFFDLLQELERDILRLRWESLKMGKELSNKDAMIDIMEGWSDRDGHKRKKHIVFPVGVPLAYIQSIRRNGQPFITEEFARKSHGEMTHWLQEHIWRRFCYRYPEKCLMQPSKFLRELGHVHPAFPDAIYEAHMPNLANPANTNFWCILQYYLPMLSSWS